MKKLLALALSFICFTASAQDSLKYYNQSREQIKTTGMKVLGSWAIGNIAIGGISAIILRANQIFSPDECLMEHH